MLKNNADVKLQKDGNFRGKAIETFLFDEYVYQSIVNFCDKNNVKLLQFFSALWAFQTGKSMGNDIVTIGNFDIENSFNYKSYEINMEQTIIDLINSKKDKSSTKLTELNFGNFGYNDFSGVVLYQLEKNRNSVNKGDFQLEIGLQQTEGKLKIVYNFDTDSISSMMLKLLHNRIEMICKQVMSRQAILLKDIEILHELEKQQVLIKYNETYSEYPNNKTIIELFEEQVNKTPNAIAIEFAGQELTYQQFNARTNYLGKLLREKGVGPDKIVAIITDRSIEMILGIFAVLKAGGAYLPIDPSQPIDRINYILEDSGTDILLSGHGADNVVNNIINNVAIIDLTGCKEEIATNLEHISKQNHLAYVIYTSGTTGNPKGVMVENRNLMNLIYWMLKDDFKETEVIMQKTTYAFDLSIWEMFLWCIRGAKLFLLPKEDERDFQKIAEKIKKHNVTRLSFVPSVLEEFLFYTDVNKLTSLKRIQLSGEALPIELANKYNENYSVGANLVNSYGPTETTVFATSHMVPINEKQKGIHIGKPIANTQIYIMNNEHLCGVGMVGEIYIGGEGVTRGYLNKPQLTAEKFVENPFKPGDTVYRTGDLGRWLESGDIEYLGRIDDQVKVRGYRIELGEIKTKIREIEGIQNAAVVLKELDGEKYLCGYIVADRKMNVKKVKVQLEKKLPEYMIPTYIIQMESLPVTRNGKLDKNVLPNPKHISYEKYVAPRDETERYISGIFQEILRVNRVGIDDSFFELGGHSLRAIRLVNMLEQKYGTRIPLRKILENSTVRKLSEEVKRDANREQHVPIKKQPEKNYYEMSSAQKRLYVIDQMQEPNITYNIPLMIKFDEKINTKQLYNALTKLTERHELLRTHFEQINNKFIQVVEDRVEIDFSHIEEKSTEILNVYKKFIKPFDLKKAPLMRTMVIETEKNESILLIDIHHIIYDEGSAQILLNDLANFYNGKKLPELNIQYKDYSVWENARDLNEQKQYWLNEFSDEIPLLNLKTDFPRPQYQSYSGKRAITKLSKDIKGLVRGVQVKTDATEYMIVLSTFMLLLNRYSRQEEIVIGSPVAGRTHVDTQDILGMFVNTLAIKGNLHPDMKYIELIQQLKEKCLRALENQDYPFEELVENIRVERDASRNPIFDVMFVLQNNESTELTFGKQKAQAIEMDNNTAKFDLTVSMTESEDGYELIWEYSTDLFKDETIERMSQHFSQLLTNTLKNPQKELCEFELLSEEERQKVLIEFNDTEVTYSQDKTIIELFEEQVERTPDNIALEFGQISLTYRELNSKANYLGEVLRKTGVKPDSVVGITSERSLEMVIGIYGILKSGAAYLPIDPKSPRNRMEFIIKDSNIKIMLGGPGSKDLLNGLSDVAIVDITECNEERESNLKVISKPNHLAYVIYTSGTTGMPKGVMIENRNIVNQVFWQIENGNYTEKSVIVQKTAFFFDGSAWEIFPCSVAGCKLSILNEDQNKDPGELIKFLPHNQIALTPSMLRMILEYIEDHDQAEVFQLINKLYLAAEPISKDLLERLRELMGGRFGNLCNLYGPTETTVTATSYHFSNQANIEKVPIGKPISNTQVYIMNGNTLCGIGVPGELCIAGAGVSRGYLNNPMLTAEKFVENPYKLGEKIYRTGDLACWLEDGNIEYLGRIDDQVKIRGFRIELGEIEEKIRTLPGIQDAVVVVKENNDEKYLCGYLVCKAEWNVSEIKMKLKSMLPDYMVPTYIMQIDKLPITRNGKLDKKALPCPEFVLAENYVAPRNKIESAIIEMYKEILHIEQVGIDNDFFELGGHSLKATVLVNSIERKFGMRIPLRKVMELKTVRNLAEEIKEVDGYKLYSPIEKQVDRHSFELTSAQKRLYIIDQMQGENIIYNTPQILEVNGYLDLNRLEKAFQKLIQRHDILRTHFIMENGTPIQKITDSIEFLLEFEVINKELDIQQLLNEFVEPFNLSESPLLRAKVVQITENKSILIIDIHHIICDGVSKKTLLGDLSKFYEGKYLATPEIQYKDYSVWENNRELFGQKNYWLNEFAEEIPVLDLITDNPRTQKKSFKGQNIITKLGLKYKNAIKQLEKETGATEYMVLLSTFMLLLSRYSRQEEIVVGSPISGRTHSDTIDMLGMFVNTLAIKGNIQSSQRFIDLVAQLREKCLNAFDNQEYPFEELVDQLSVEGDPSRNPIFDVMFAFQNNENEKITFGEADVVLLPTPNNVSKFDLTMNIEGIEDGYELNWEYCTDLFKEKTITRMNEQFVQLLKNVLKDPQKKLCEIELLTDTEKEKVIYEFNRTHIEYQNDKTIIERFEEQVEKTPDKIAVEYEGESLTYRQLNAKANTIGKNLRDKGVHTESIVGIVTKRSLEMIVGIYGVLKAGGAYLPIDSEYPVERINFMLNDSKAKVLLVGEGNQSIVDHIDASTILVNLTNCEEDQINPVHISQPDSLAYVIYTSGTTGTPKGVMVENRNVMNLSNWQIDEGKYGEDTVVLQNLNYIFDGSVWEIFPVALSGGKLLIISEIQNKEPRELLTLLEKKQALLVPSMFRMLLEHAEKNGKADELKQFERLYLGAEPLTSDLIAKYEEITGASIDNINNLYGPTEATVVATSYRFNGKDNREIIPIGKPIANTQIYILNNKSICGIGMPGELCIGGSGVSRGYLNRAELTAEKFVVNPYRPNERIYRTGDLARWNEDGNIEYLGRIDEQVKIRGFRIELGEIEERIRDVEGISDAVVIVKENNGDKYLCGYVISSESIDIKYIKEKLRGNLPEYMIPTYIMQLDNFPLTKNGKLDRKSFPDPQITDREDFVAPRDNVEEGIMGIFKEILEFEVIGIDDSFFELGGHSLKATKLVNALEEKFKVRVPLSTILTEKTIRKIAEKVRNTEVKSNSDTIAYPELIVAVEEEV